MILKPCRCLRVTQQHIRGSVLVTDATCRVPVVWYSDLWLWTTTAAALIGTVSTSCKAVGWQWWLSIIACTDREGSWCVWEEWAGVACRVPSDGCLEATWCHATAAPARSPTCKYHAMPTVLNQKINTSILKPHDAYNVTTQMWTKWLNIFVIYTWEN